MDKDGNITDAYIDLTDIDLTETGQEYKKKHIRFSKVCKQDFIKVLKNLPRDKYGRSYGFILYTLPSKKKFAFTEGHITNFYVDANREVYFIDAQDYDHPERWIQSTLAEGYREEVFYMSSALNEDNKLVFVKDEPQELATVAPYVKVEPESESNKRSEYSAAREHLESQPFKSPTKINLKLKTDCSQDTFNFNRYESTTKAVESFEQAAHRGLDEAQQYQPGLCCFNGDQFKKKIKMDPFDPLNMDIFLTYMQLHCLLILN